MDDDQDKALNQDAGNEASESTTPVDEPKAPEEVETPTEDTKPTGEVESGETETETGESSKKGANARIRELNAKAKSAQEENKSLKQKLAELTNPIGSRGYTPSYTPQADQTEATVDQVLAMADARAELKIRQSEAVNRINNEASEAMKAHPELDPDSDSFDKDLSDSITEATIAYVKSNPYSASPKSFVEKLMRPYKRSVVKEVGQERENIARQVSQSAVRPTSVSTSGKRDFKDMSTEELEATLGFHY